jgi:hypothetical protein
MGLIAEEVTVNKHQCNEILHHLYTSAHHKRPELWNRKNWLLPHDNTPGHCFMLVQVELAKQQGTLLSHHPRSPDFIPCDFAFFSPWKKSLWGDNFNRPRRYHCLKGNCKGPSNNYLTGVYPAAMPTLADLHSGQQQLFWWRMWIM